MDNLLASVRVKQRTCLYVSIMQSSYSTVANGLLDPD
jgi:hypothetical protein